MNSESPGTSKHFVQDDMGSVNWKGLGAIFVVLVVGSMFLLSSCARKSQSIPVNISNLYVPPFKNETNESGLEDLLTDEAIQEFQADANLQLVTKKKADAMLIGRITRYKKIPLLYNDQDVVQQWKLRIEMSLALKDLETGKILWRKPDIFRETTYSDIIPPIETELDAKKRVIRQLARDAVSSTVEGWPYIES
ncbi:MAG: LPS assembly lipoprotein LptE [bacterium]